MLLHTYSHTQCIGFSTDLIRILGAKPMRIQILIRFCWDTKTWIFLRFCFALLERFYKAYIGRYKGTFEHLVFRFFWSQFRGPRVRTRISKHKTNVDPRGSRFEPLLVPGDHQQHESPFWFLFCLIFTSDPSEDLLEWLRQRWNLLFVQYMFIHDDIAGYQTRRKTGCLLPSLLCDRLNASMSQLTLQYPLPQAISSQLAVCKRALGIEPLQ